MSVSSADKNGERERKLEVLQIDDLKVDHRYQRELNQKLVEEILVDLDPLACDVITVSKRKTGGTYIINGQHRAAALRLSGETEVLAFVYEGMTVSKEADLRLKSNHRRGDTSLERFWAQVTAGNAESKQIIKLLEKFDTQINKSASVHTGINCVAAIEALFREDEQLLEDTLRMVQNAHGEISGDAAKVPVLRGVFWMLKVHTGEFSKRSMVERMRLHGPEDLSRKAQSHKAVNGGPAWVNYYRAIIEAYNYRRAEHTRLEVKTKFWGRSERPEGAR